MRWRALPSRKGVALGRLPVIDASLKDGGLVAPFGIDGAVKVRDRSYWLISKEGRASAGVEPFVSWLRAEARLSAMSAVRAPKRSRL